MKRLGQYIDRNPELEVIAESDLSSIHVGLYKYPYFKRSWHFHPEYEILLITAGYGRRLVGDHSEDFTAGDLVMLGPQLPHAWISDEKFVGDINTEDCSSIYIQFSRSLFTSSFYEMGEFNGVRSILEKSLRGLKILGKGREEVSVRIRELPSLDGLDRILSLIKILSLINRGESSFLASEEYLEKKFYFKSKRMNRVHTHLMEHFRDPLSVSDGAELANMTLTSFCRFFKTQTETTFTAYLNRIRVDFACKLLLNTETPIKEIAYECGYNSISYFSQIFKELTGLSPKQYRNPSKGPYTPARHPENT